MNKILAAFTTAICFACSSDEVLDRQYYSCDAEIISHNTEVPGHERYQALLN